MEKIYYATGNKGKFAMVQKYFEQNLPEIKVEQVRLDLVEEQTLDLEGIAMAKARQAWNLLGHPVLVDDAGFYIDQYHEFPGTMTKFVYEALGFKGMYKLYEKGDRAHFTTHIVFANQDGCQVFTGVCTGTLVKPDLDIHDSSVPFAYLLLPDGESDTLHEAIEKKGYSDQSPRILALAKFSEFIKEKGLV